MEGLPVELCYKIFCFLDYQNLSIAQQVCRKWKVLGADNLLWANLFKARWGENHAVLRTPHDTKSWKAVYEVQDRCDRVGLELKIIREGIDYYLIHHGEIRRHLGSRTQNSKRQDATSLNRQSGEVAQEGSLVGATSYGILDRILFFIGDLEVASNEAKRSRLM
ncbi:putative E3 ubiquitin ligase complex SCF subunit sconB [Bienertia sinuspersici]